jgi:predicted RecB family nuclease
MKRNSENRLIWSPSDLVTYLESPFAVWMQRMHLEKVAGIKPDKESADQKLIQNQGNDHESRHLDRIKRTGVNVREIKQFGSSSEEETAAAVNDQVEVIFQARLTKGDFSGMADFIILGEPDLNGVRRYEIHDTKLASKAKPYHIIQLCCYAEMLEPITGYLPERIAVILGNGDTKSFRTADFFDYYLSVKSGFESLMASFDPASDPPIPAPRANHGRWQSYADRWLDERDHLVRVAGITAGQIKKLEAAGISTLTALATTDLASVAKLGGEMLATLKRQAYAQWKTREQAAATSGNSHVVPWFEVIPPPPANPSRGLGMLPPASPGDVFFDIEGYPLVEGGLEYLLGASYREGGKDKFLDWWAHDAVKEKASFEEFIDWVYARWTADPAMHIYHYAPYEITAVRKLMGRYATREDEVDTLLRRGVFVDLYRVARQALLFGDDSYSIKRIEKLYFEGRKADVKDAASSIVFYAKWMASGESGNWKESPLLKKIRNYNEEDCVSTGELADWLRRLQRESGIPYVPPGVRGNETDAVEDAPPTNENEARRRAIAERMLTEFARARAAGDDDPEWRIHELLAYLLNFYRREEKPVFWAMFDRLERTAQELSEDANCLEGIERTATPTFPIKRSTGLEFRFDPNQDSKIREGSKVIIREDRRIKGEIESFDPEGTLVLKLGPGAMALLSGEPLPDLISLIPDEFVSADLLKNAIERVVVSWREARLLPPALRQLFRREGPLSEAPLRKIGESALDTCQRVVKEMDGAALIIQGPPGTGKTYTGSHLIALLLQRGKSVGILSNSHKAIVNLLRATAKVCDSGLSGYRVGGDRDEDLEREAPGLIQTTDSGKVAVDFHSGLVAGTAWFFAREEMEGKLDYLFIDEAGQVSLAHLTAVSASAHNMVLMGDQMQLSQPIQGSHPGESGRSILEYALEDFAVVPPHLGVLLDTSWRMHPSICSFISETVYEGRLKADPSTAARVLSPAPGRLVNQNSGILFSPVVHEGNTQSSREEADRIVELTAELLASTVTTADGTRPVAISDILFVAPYNMQVRLLRERLPVGAKVGSVDKFQGQEAPIVILSLGASAGEYGSRGLGFILDRNRINVAISRAQTLAIVVSDPRIANADSNSVEEMRLVNVFCKLLAYA